MLNFKLISVISSLSVTSVGSILWEMGCFPHLTNNIALFIDLRLLEYLQQELSAENKCSLRCKCVKGL